MKTAAQNDAIFLMLVQHVTLTGRKHTKEMFQSTDAMSLNKNVPKQQTKKCEHKKYNRDLHPS